MTEADLPAAGRLRELVGWNQTLADWQRLLRLEPQGCFAALKNSELVGTVTTTSYGEALAWIGMMLVHPEHRRQGIARQLMERAVQYLQGKRVKTIKLDATPAGQPLYEQLGFVAEWTLTRWQRPQCGKGTSEDGGWQMEDGKLSPAAASNLPRKLQAGSSIAAQSTSPAVERSQCGESRVLEEGDWPAIIALDHAALGAPRADLLRSLADESRHARVWPVRGRVLGWGLLRAGANADYVGPLLCSEVEGALALISALVPAAGDRQIFWDVPDSSEPAQTAARRLGFQPLRPLTRMRLGLVSAAGDPVASFAIADPAVG